MSEEPQFSTQQEVEMDVEVTIADRLRGAANDLETEITKARVRDHDKAALLRAELRVTELRQAADDAEELCGGCGHKRSEHPGKSMICLSVTNGLCACDQFTTA